MTKQKRHIITLLVNNQPGVLIRIALVFAKRGYNIDSLVTHPIRQKRFSIMSITATGEEKVLRQILKQLNAIVDVIHASDKSDEPSVQLELSLMKIKFVEKAKAEILNIINSLDCKIVDIGDESIIFTSVGTETYLNSVENIIKQYSIIEIIRTGVVLMIRGSETTA